MFKKILLIPIVLLVLLSTDLKANPGDTTLVQCFTFDSIHARQAWFQFPEQTQSWNKILMYYTLKCDPQTPWDGYDCGEWDYTTFTYIFEHTGLLDSTEYTHSLFTANGEAPDEFAYANNPTYQIYPRTEYFYHHSDTVSLNQATMGNDSDIGTAPFSVTGSDAKYYYVWKAADLISNGLLAGDITGMQFYFETAGAYYSQYKIHLASTEIDVLNLSELQSLSYSLVYNHNLSLENTGWQLFDFSQHYLWDGVSDIIVCFDYVNSYGIASLQGAIGSAVAGLQSVDFDKYLIFNGPDYIEVPANSYSTLSNEITIAFWLYGDPDIQPQNDMLLEASDEFGNRKICIHLPWSNGSVYWDAGNDGYGYDRIYKAANFSDYAGKWNHWAFTKNTVSGEMKIYLNGVLWHSGTNLTKTLEGIDRFVLGSNQNTNPANCYDGNLDDFYVFNSELSANDISLLMQENLHSGDGLYSNILVNYQFNQEFGMFAYDSGPAAANGDMMGIPQFLSYNGMQRFKGFENVYFRPNIVLEQGDFTSVLDSLIVFDTVYMPQVQVVTYQNVDDYTIEAIDTTLCWAAMYQYMYNAMGVLVDSILISDGNLVNDELVYYSPAFEVVNTIQLQNFVTPYGIGLDLGSDGFTWVYDVTEYGYLLHDMVELRAHNTQELIDLKFVMIEGTPPRDILDFKQIWRGNYGHHAIAINDAMPAVKLATLPAAKMFTVRTRATGHGMQGNGNCAEFCPTSHNLSIDGMQQYEWLNWKECSDNPVYPQGGTWIFDRAGWCPGSFADTYNWDISPYVTPGDSVEIDYGMTQYPGTNGEGNYQVAVQFIQYGDYNFTNDAAVHDIIAPSNRDLHNRFNPICNQPRIQIINNGSETLYSLNINYGIAGDADNSYQWTGELGFGEVEEVVLPALNYSEFSQGNQVFEVQIDNPNGVDDEYVYNNLMYSQFETVDIYDVPTMFVVKTNNYGNQTHYQITNSNGEIMVDRDGLDDNTYYYDTLNYDPGCYEINFFDRDQGFNGQDGLNFWYWAGTAYDDGTGFAKMRQVGGVYLKHFESDFGGFFNYQFVISDFNSQEGNTINTDCFFVYPNPGSNSILISRNMHANQNAKVELLTLYGTQILSISMDEGVSEIALDMSEYAQGIYIFRYTCNDVCKTLKWIKN